MKVPRVAALRDTLAAAYAAGGRYSDAISTAREAEAIARERGDAALLPVLAACRAACEDGRPWREGAADADVT